MAVPARESEPHAFVREEFVRALKEQLFGITSYEIISSTPLKATARIVSLEGETILSSLSSRGFQLHSPTESPTDPDLDVEIVFETLEQLLQSVSPQYDAARRSSLIAKLDSLASLASPEVA